jgi:suppressor of ftsI
MQQSARWHLSVLQAGRSYRTFARLVATFLALSSASICAQTSSPQVGRPLPRLPEASSPLRLEAVSDPVSGRSAFSFQGIEVPPVIRAAPGTKIEINFVNEMSSSSRETCVDGTCRNMTNLHFHGLHVSPDAPQDDVISMMAMPGQSLHYAVDVPLDQPPGLYWYHTHPHGESYQQSLDGMSGAIVVEGIARYVPQVAGMTEQILVLRDFALDEDASSAGTLSKVVSRSHTRCGEATGQPARIFTVNGVIRPKIQISPGERQFWRIVNASPDLYADLEIDSAVMKLVAMDGMPLAFHDPDRRQEDVQHILLAPAGRVEAIVEGPKHVVNASLRSRCVDTGPDGDPNPAMVIADLDETGSHLHTSNNRSHNLWSSSRRTKMVSTSMTKNMRQTVLP